jgi:hypothetical protein
VEGETDGLGPGLWELLVTEDVRGQLRGLDLELDIDDLRNAEAADRLSRHVAAVVARLIQDLPENQQRQVGTELVQGLIRHLGQLADLPDGRVLYALYDRLPTGETRKIPRPLTPLLDTTLLTNARASRRSSTSCGPRSAAPGPSMWSWHSSAAPGSTRCWRTCAGTVTRADASGC